MKRLMLFIVTAGLLLLPIAGYAAEYGNVKSKAAPVSQPLVREGDYAIKLVGTLNIGTVTDETKAEDILAAAGIAPASGWISDFPVTPEIIAQVNSSVLVAADGGKIPLARKEADSSVTALNNELGLSVTVAAGKSPEGAEAAPQYNEPAEINNYYSDEGPPIVTYYAPPPDYWYLYAWDPWPFWCGGFFFPGFFILTDFSRVVVVNNSVVVVSNSTVVVNGSTVVVNGTTSIVSNHVIDPVTKASVRIDPVSVRPTTKTAFTPIGSKSWTPVASTKGAATARPAVHTMGAFNKASASNILSHSASLSRTTGARTGGSWVGSKGAATAPSTRGRSSGSPSMSGRSLSNSGGSSRSFSNSGGGGRSFSNSGGSSRSFSNSGGSSRSFSNSGGGSRSFSNSGGGGRSFSSGGGRSFSSPSMGGSRSFGGGGFGGGGGCRGGRC